MGYCGISWWRTLRATSDSVPDPPASWTAAAERQRRRRFRVQPTLASSQPIPPANNVHNSSLVAVRKYRSAGWHGGRTQVPVSPIGNRQPLAIRYPSRFARFNPVLFGLIFAKSLAFFQISNLQFSMVLGTASLCPSGTDLGPRCAVRPSDDEVTNRFALGVEC